MKLRDSDKLIYKHYRLFKDKKFRYKYLIFYWSEYACKNVFTSGIGQWFQWLDWFSPQVILTSAMSGCVAISQIPHTVSFVKRVYKNKIIYVQQWIFFTFSFII